MHPLPARRPWRELTSLIVLIAVVCALFHHRLTNYVRLSVDPWEVNDDARPLISPFLRYYQPNDYPPSYQADYALAAMPVGYRAFYTITASMGLDPRVTAKVVPFACLAALLLLIGATARRLGEITAGRLGRHAAAGIAIAVILASDVYLTRLTGGLPRAFAYPLLAGGALALVAGRPLWLAALVPVGIALYPTAGVALGLALAAYLLLVPRADRGAAGEWTLRRRFTVLAVTAVACAVIALPTLVALRPYGPAVRMNRVDEFPENGPGGRFGPDDRAPFPSLWKSIARAASRTFEGPARLVGMPEPTMRERQLLRARVRAGLLLGTIGAAVVAWRGAAGRRLLALAAAAVAAHVLSRLVSPYLHLPQRYVIYPVPTLLTVLFPIGAIVIASAVARAARAACIRWGRTLPSSDSSSFDSPSSAPSRTLAGLTVAGAIALAAVIIVPMRAGLRPGAPEAGFSVRINPADPVYAAIAALPDDALVAGWPRGVLNSAPYVTGRPVYLESEMHQAFHAAYALEMRRRLRLLVDAYFARDLGPLHRLRDEGGVTHLLVERSHFAPGAPPPPYFVPFNAWIADAHAALDGATPAALRVVHDIDGAAILDEGPYVLLDLRRLPPTNQSASADAARRHGDVRDSGGGGEEASR